MSEESRPPVEHVDALEMMDWNEIHEPGSYLHLSSGLIARVDDEDLARAKARPRSHGVAGLVVLLLPNARAPLALLRQIAQRHGYRVNA